MQQRRPWTGRDDRAGAVTCQRAPIARCRSELRLMQSLPATSNASFNRLSAPLNEVFQSPSNCWRAGPSHRVPANAELTALMTPSMAAFCCFIDRPRPFNCSGLAPYMLISVPPASGVAHDIEACRDAESGNGLVCEADLGPATC